MAGLLERRLALGRHRMAQAAHFCGFQSLDLRGGTQLRADSPNTTLCMTCLMAQSAAAIVLSIAFSSVFRRRVRVQIPADASPAFSGDASSYTYVLLPLSSVVCSPGLSIPKKRFGFFSTPVVALF